MTALAIATPIGTAPDERIPCTTAYPILGLPSQQSFNHVRRRLQRVLDRETGTLMPYPEFERQCSDPRVRSAREREFCDRNVLVVPEWGGIKYPKGPWTYSRRRCEAIRDQGVDALTG